MRARYINHPRCPAQCIRQVKGAPFIVFNVIVALWDTTPRCILGTAPIYHRPWSNIRYPYCLRGHPKMSTFSLVYKQYTFSDPLPPPLQVYRPTVVGSTIWVSHSIIFIVRQPKLTLLSKYVIALAKYYDLEISVNIVWTNKIFLVWTNKICSISQYKI